MLSWTGNWMRSQADRYGWFMAMALLVGGPLSAIAPPAVALTPGTPAPMVLTPAPVLPQPPNHWGYGLGQPSDHLPRAIPRADRVVLRLGQRRVYVYEGDQELDSFPVAVGTPKTPTPTGRFEISQMIVDPVWQSPWTGEIFPPGADSALGLRWIGFTEVPGGVIGFHGTPTVSSIGQAASNGCVRLRNEDVLALYEHVRIGMTVIVEP